MSNKKDKQYLYDLGFIYELGSNIGTYKVLRDVSLNNPEKTNLKNTLDSLFSSGKIDKNFIINNLKLKHDYKHREIYTDDQYNDLCQKAFIEGLLQGINRTKQFTKSIKGGVKDIFYFQGNFINPISLEKFEAEEIDFYQDVIDVFFDKYLTSKEYDNYIQKGCFLKADCIIALTDKHKKLHINIVDNKIDLMFLLKNIVEKNGVIEGLGYLANSKKKKIQFSNINTDTSALDFTNLSDRLIDYATVSNDKNILKLIQCGSYAQSFLNFLEEKKLIDEFRDICISLSGDTNTDLSIINLKRSDKNTKDALIGMRNAYSNYDRDSSQEYKMRILEEGFKKLAKTFESNNDENKKELNKLLKLSKGEKKKIELSEEITDFTCTTEGTKNMQQQHTEVMQEKFLNDKSKIICYLAGCPGIGKTYGYKTFAFKKENESDENKEKQLTLYFSPRNAINEDFIQFFFDSKTNLLNYDDMVILNSTSVDEKLENGDVVKTVNYSTNNIENVLKSPQTNLSYRPRGRDRTFLEDDVKFQFDNGMNKMYEECFSGDGVMKKTSQAIFEYIYKVDKINKVIAYFTIQSLKYTGNLNTSESLNKILQKVVESSRVFDTRINNEAFDEFVKLCPKIYIMIDEVTGSSEGAQLFDDIKTIFIDNFYDLLTEKQKEALTLKIIVADANLPNKKLMSKYLTMSSKVEQDRIFLSSVNDEVPENVYTEDVDERTIVINANAYPASKINAKYHIYNNSIKIKNTLNGNPEEERKDIDKANESMKREINSGILYNAINDIVVKKYLQTILFIQNKKRIGDIVEKLKETWEKLKKPPLVEGKDYIILSADLTEKKRAKYIKLIEDDAFLKLHKLYPDKEKDEEYMRKLESVQYLEKEEIDLKFVLMTSTASRGISFKICQSMHILLQTSKVESFLTELSQAVYRPRGDWEFDRTHSKDLNYYISNSILYEDIDENNLSKEENYYDFEYRKNVSLLNILSYLTLLRGTVKTRIKGYEEIENNKYSIVPVGGKYVSSASTTILEQISGYRKQLNDAIFSIKSKGYKYNNEYYEDIMMNIDGMIIKIFNDSMTYVPNTVVTGTNKFEHTFASYMKAWESNDLTKLLDLNILHDFKIINGMMVFKIKSSTDELNFVNNLAYLREKLLKELYKLMDFSNVVSALKHSTNKIIKLLEFELGKNIDETLQLCENNNTHNRYVGIPLHVLSSYDDVLKYDYSTQYEDDKNNLTINALEAMKSNINQYVNCQSVFPIISDYTGNYPFITFKADNLESIYDNKYNKDYVLSSTSTNIFNLMMLDK